MKLRDIQEASYHRPIYVHWIHQAFESDNKDDQLNNVPGDEDQIVKQIVDEFGEITYHHMDEKPLDNVYEWTWKDEEGWVKQILFYPDRPELIAGKWK